MISINGNEWKVYIIPSTHPVLRKPDGSFTLGCCNNILKKIYIAEGLNSFYFKKVLCHELTHAYMYSYNIDLTVRQEEILADIMATYGQEIISVINSILLD